MDGRAFGSKRNLDIESSVFHLCHLIIFPTMASRPNLQSALLASLVALALPTLAVPLEDELVTRTYKLDIAKIQKLSGTTLAELALPPKTSPSNLLRALFTQD